MRYVSDGVGALGRGDAVVGRPGRADLHLRTDVSGDRSDRAQPIVNLAEGNGKVASTIHLTAVGSARSLSLLGFMYNATLLSHFPWCRSEIGEARRDDMPDGSLIV